MTGDYVTTGLRNVIQPARDFPHGEADVVGGGFRVSNYPANAGYSRHISNQPPRPRPTDQLDRRRLTELTRQRVVNRANAYAQYGPYVYHEIEPHGVAPPMASTAPGFPAPAGAQYPYPSPSGAGYPAADAAGPPLLHNMPVHHVRTARPASPADGSAHVTTSVFAGNPPPQHPQHGPPGEAPRPDDEGPPEAPDSPLRGVVRSAPQAAQEQAQAPAAAAAAAAAAAGTVAAAEAWLAATSGGPRDAVASDVTLQPPRGPAVVAAAAGAAAVAAGEPGEADTPNAARASASASNPFHATRPGGGAPPVPTAEDVRGPEAADLMARSFAGSEGGGGGVGRVAVDVEGPAMAGAYRPGDSLQGPLPGGSSPRLGRGYRPAHAGAQASALGGSSSSAYAPGRFRGQQQLPYQPPAGRRPDSAAAAVGGSATGSAAYPNPYPYPYPYPDLDLVREAGRAQTQAYGYGGGSAAAAEQHAPMASGQWESAAPIEGDPAYLAYANLMAKGEFGGVSMSGFPPGPQGGPAWRSFIMRSRPPPRPGSPSASASVSSSQQRGSGTWSRGGVGSRSQLPPQTRQQPQPQPQGPRQVASQQEVRSSAPAAAGSASAGWREEPLGGGLDGAGRSLARRSRAELWAARSSLAADARTLRLAARLLRSENRRLGGEAAALAGSLEGLAEGSLSPEFVRLHAEAVTTRLGFAAEVAPLLAGGLGLRGRMREALPNAAAADVAAAAAAAANAAAAVAAAAQQAVYGPSQPRPPSQPPQGSSESQALSPAVLSERPSTAPAAHSSDVGPYGHAYAYGSGGGHGGGAVYEQEYEMGKAHAGAGEGGSARVRYVAPEELRRRRDDAAEAQLRRRLGAALSRSYDQALGQRAPSDSDPAVMLEIIALARQLKAGQQQVPQGEQHPQREQEQEQEQGVGAGEVSQQSQPEHAHPQRRVTFAAGTRGGESTGGSAGGGAGGDTGDERTYVPADEEGVHGRRRRPPPPQQQQQHRQQEAAAAAAHVGDVGGASHLTPNLYPPTQPPQRGQYSSTHHGDHYAVERSLQEQRQGQGQRQQRQVYRMQPDPGVAAAALAVAAAAESLARRAADHARASYLHGGGTTPAGQDSDGVAGRRGDSETEGAGEEPEESEGADADAGAAEAGWEEREARSRRVVAQRVRELLDARSAGAELYPRPPPPAPPQPFFELPEGPLEDEGEPEPLSPRSAAARAAAAAAEAAASCARPAFISAAAVLAGTGGRRMTRDELQYDPTVSAVDQLLAPPESSLLALFYLACRRPVPHPDDLLAVLDPDLEAHRLDPDGEDAPETRGVRGSTQQVAAQEEEEEAEARGRGGAGGNGDGDLDQQASAASTSVPDHGGAAVTPSRQPPPQGDLFMDRGSPGRAPYGQTYRHVAAWTVRDSLLVLERQALEMRLAGRERVPAAYLQADRELSQRLNLDDPDLEDRADELREALRQEEFDERVAREAEEDLGEEDRP